MEKKRINLPIDIPLVIEDDLLHNEMIGYVLFLTGGILLDGQTDERTEEEMQIIRVYCIINKILSCYLSINQASNFIKRRPTIRELDNNEEMTVIDYYNYHYDVIVHKLATIRDLSFKLINKIYGLRLNDRSCNWDNIWKRRDLISVPGILDIQTLLYNFMEEVQRDRNESSHNGFIDINIFKDIDGIEYYRDKIIGESKYSSDKYKRLLIASNAKNIIAYVIENADTMIPSDGSCMLPTSVNAYSAKQFRGGYNMNYFHNVNPGEGSTGWWNSGSKPWKKW